MAGFEMGAGGRGHKICDLSLELQRPSGSHTVGDGLEVGRPSQMGS